MENYVVYSGDMLLKNLNMFTHIHCATLSLVGSQFIFLNSCILTWALLSSFKQNLMHLFWDVSIFFESRLFKDGYQAEHA